MRQAGLHYPIDFPRLARTLPARIDGGCSLVKLQFFIAPSPYAHTREREEPLFSALRNSSSTELVLGWHETKHCRKCGNEYHREKGTDVAIATSLVDGAHRDVFDTALLITGDEDFVGAIQSVRAVSTEGGVNPQFGKRVIWGHFGTQAVDGRLNGACDERYLLEDRFLRTVQRPNLRRDHRRRG
jgi:hypothetical protein